MLFNIHNALAVASVLVASTAADGFKVLPRGADGVLVGCYSSIPGYGASKSWTYQSSGWCLDRCYGQSKAAFALTGGSDCVCGDTLPPDSDKVSTDKCSKSCSGWPEDKCGGNGYYSVYTTNYEDDVPTYSDSSSSTTTTGGSSTSTTEASVAVSTAASGQTTVVTAHSEATPTAETSDEKKASSSKNTAAIAAGVVVGVVGFAALCGAGFFWWRSKNNKSNAAMGGPTGGYGRDSNPPSMSDSRFDGDYMAQRRQSNGSIDDDHDFSRRILQVTNPDR
ncbi:unnamed protein product [Penicillium salamii]|uniref:WSC domain-containing protein n=1 Tax=Penicillium salamii TaxID=1612424 RepID=A0A9W4IS50_9EURO|nr:unnamed protein product [Penicillium salamii]CAG8355646.1 unnamed protein product [Penicillium salamii]CAG8371361.1 unnamed protein product [Penicillium salamii]